MVMIAFGADAAGAKDEFTYFAEADFWLVDETGTETRASVTAIDYPTGRDILGIGLSRSNPACADPAAGCDYILLSGYVRAPVEERDVQIQGKLRWARTDASIEFPDQVSGSTVPVTIELDWKSTGDFAPEFDDGSGFRRAVAQGTIRVATEELLGGQSDTGAELSRFILSS